MNEQRTVILDSNNNVAALSLVDVEGDPTGSIFLFYPDDQADYRRNEPWFAGNYTLLDQLIAGCRVVGGGLSIPFTNGPELYPTREKLLDELHRVGTLAEAIAIFGFELTPTPSLEPAAV